MTVHRSESRKGLIRIGWMKLEVSFYVISLFQVFVEEADSEEEVQVIQGVSVPPFRETLLLAVLFPGVQEWQYRGMSFTREEPRNLLAR